MHDVALSMKPVVMNSPMTPHYTAILKLNTGVWIVSVG
jgi:hypothetical protein